MHVIAFATQKGGSGKTTLAANIAVQAERTGDGPVALIDVDPQGSLAGWWNERSAPAPVLAQASIVRLAEHIRQMRELGIKLLIIDTPPAIKSTIGHVINVSDLVVIPTRPSPQDLRAVGKTVEIVESLGKPFVFVINGAHPIARITTEAVASLSDHGPVAASIIHQRTDYAASTIDGRAVMEVAGRSRSPDEIAELWRYLKKCLHKAPQRGVSRQKVSGAAPRKKATAEAA